MSARHLRVATPDERSYIVARTQLASPGRPYVVAECTPGALVSPPPGLETFTRGQMQKHRMLKDALRAWDEQDDTLAGRERAARARLTETRRTRAMRMHPSGREDTMRLIGPLESRGSTA